MSHNVSGTFDRVVKSTHPCNGSRGTEVTEYPGLASREAIIDATIASESSSVLGTSSVGGASHERGIPKNREEAIGEHWTEAGIPGADAVVGAAFDYEEMAEGTLWVAFSGTAVETR